MCERCWEGHGSPRIDDPVIRAAARAFADVPPDGNLHIIVEDWNIDDIFIEMCRESHAADRAGVGRDDLGREGYLLGLLANLGVAERASALALHDGFWSIGPSHPAA